jgi:hypothetical protein
LATTSADHRSVGLSRNFAGKEEVGLHALKLALEEELSGELGASTIDADLLGRELRLRPGDKVHKDTFDYVCQVYGNTCLYPP